MTALDIALLVSLIVYIVVGVALVLLAQREVPGVNEPRRYVGGRGGDLRWRGGGSISELHRRKSQP